MTPRPYRPRPAHAADRRNGGRTVLEVATGRRPATPADTRRLVALATAARVRSEHEEQVDVVAWAEAHRAVFPGLGFLFAIPNGGHRAEAVAGKQKAEGVRAGYPDLGLDVARGRWHGLRIEMKKADGTLSDVARSQRDWLAGLAEQGYRCCVAFGADAARAALLEYLTGVPVSFDAEPRAGRAPRLVWWTPEGPATPATGRATSTP